MVIFLDGLQWADEASIDILSLLLTSKKLSNLIFICAYRSNEVDDEHFFVKLMNNVKKARTIQVHSCFQRFVLFDRCTEEITYMGVFVICIVGQKRPQQ